jgi:carbamoyltransferase
MMIRKSDAVKHWYIFPHMGDGGMALGSALYADHEINGTARHEFSAYLGTGYTEADTEDALKKERWLRYHREGDPAGRAAELIGKGNYVFWFQGNMEYGPRALGNRSILAPSSSESVKDKLNMYVKKREWFQPFAPSMMEEEAERLLEYDGKGVDRFMTMAYMTREDRRDALKAVMHVDGSARAQMVGQENRAYHELIGKVRKETGDGVVLNTSFNVHGMPIVMSPEDALRTMRETKTRYMLMNGFFVENRLGV